MRLLIAPSLALLAGGGLTAAASDHSRPKPQPQPPYQYHTLPPLREQADIQNGWTATRSALIPGLLRKYGVDAWLVNYLSLF